MYALSIVKLQVHYFLKNNVCFCCRLFIIIGVVLLVSSARLIRILPRPLRRLMRASVVDRNLGVRHPSSIRTRDPSPSTVIQATTLHHLIQSPTKEKP